MRSSVLTVLAWSLFFTGSAAAQLPTDANVKDAWHQGSFDDVRIFYGYSSDKVEEGVTDFGCRVDYYHDGRIRLLVSEGYYDVPDAPHSSTSVFYMLEPTKIRQHSGYELKRVSYGYLRGPAIKLEPVLFAEDPFTKRCVPLLDDLFKQIPEPEVVMFRMQYGKLFGLK